MANNSWTAFSFKDQLVDQVLAAVDAANPAYDPVPKVLSYEPNQDEDQGDSIWVGWNMTDDTEKIAMGEEKPQDEYVLVKCRVRSVRVGAGEEVARKAETTARDYMGEVDTQVRTALPSVGIQTFTGILTNRDSRSYTWHTGGYATRECVIFFDVSYHARTHKND